MHTLPRMHPAAIGPGLAILALTVAAGGALADDGWPREIPSKQATILMFQPQPDTFEGDVLASRAAVSVQQEGVEEPIFGAIWMSSRIDTDRDNRTVTIVDVDVTRVRFPDASDENQQALADLIEDQVPQWDLEISLDRLLTSLELAERKQIEAEKLQTDPPKILFNDYPTVLVLLDGDPQLRPVEGSSVMQVINTPFFLAFDSSSKKYYLDGGGDLWFVADEPTGPWDATSDVPSAVVAVRPEPPVEVELPEDDPEADLPEDDRIPKIIVSTEPAELIVTDGEPAYTPLEGSDLLYMSNTDSDVLVDVDTQRHFVVLSGRWYASKSLSGPWTYVSSDELPASFSKIAPDSDMGHLLVFVSGTEEAKDAAMDAQIPQTSAIQRSEINLVVTYDGKPEWEKIEGSSLTYAKNTETAVFKHKKQYYACHQGVWFVADDPLGPWVVAGEVPSEIYALPASCPHYNVKYVYIYDSTPEVVYVGYLPGYTNTYVYNTTIVYGTGYTYPSWYGTYYYPRPATWGFHVRYNPWYGWSFGFSYSTGRFTFSIGRGGWYGRGWWGPSRYRPYHRGYHRGYRQGAHAGYRAGYRAGQRDSYRNNNLYDSKDNRSRNAKDSARNRPDASGASNRQNNVYTDKHGDVYRKGQDGGWEKREGNSWQKDASAGAGAAAGDRSAGAGDGSRTTDRSAGSSSGTRPSSGSTQKGSRSTSRSSGGSSLNRDYNARQRGSSRTSSYNRSRGGGSRGGGRRR